jgi:hypothetical protein
MNHVAVSVKFLDTFDWTKAGRRGFENQGLWKAEEVFGKAIPVRGSAAHKGGLEYIGLADHAGAIDLPCAKEQNISMMED